MAFFDNDGPLVDTVLDTRVARPGEVVHGRVHIHGGKEEFVLERVVVGLLAQAEIELKGEQRGQRGLWSGALQQVVARRAVRLAANQELGAMFTDIDVESTIIPDVGSASGAARRASTS